MTEFVVVGTATMLFLGVVGRMSQVMRDSSKIVTCQNNLRTLGWAQSVYTQENDYYPGGHWHGESPRWIYVWNARLRQVLDGNLDTFHCPDAPQGFAWVPKYEKDWRPWPPNESWPRYGYDEDEVPHIGDPYNTRLYFSYGYNESGNREMFSGQRGLGMHPDPEDYERWAYLAEVPVEAVVNPADMIAIGDSRGDGDDDHVIYGRPKFVPGGDWPQNRWPGERHRQGANIVFCDGHVEWDRRDNWVTAKSLPNPEARGRGYTLTAQRRWNSDNQPHMLDDLSDSDHQ
ncbi:MAG: hypothetical protein BroJett003_22550 [Planctomycetota bacterium]|nr:MAG: hypothetical protein BroJett003_22550 [Planctomycetota bacterium]